MHLSMQYIIYMTLPVASLSESYENFVKSLTLLRQCPIPTKGVKFIALLCHIPACRAVGTVGWGIQWGHLPLPPTKLLTNY